MARFLKHTELASEIIELFEEAEDGITIVSPYIKLHPDIKKVLKAKQKDDEFFIEILYGKNEDEIHKSLSQTDLDFFKKFENVEIYYNPDLHAKYYANEFRSIITSINLHEYSLENNIEVGVCFDSGRFGKDSRLDVEAFEYFGEIFSESEKVFSKAVKKRKYLFGLYKNKTGSEVDDHTKEFYKDKHPKPPKSAAKRKNGFCIRTGAVIPFNIKRPYSAQAFQSWNKYQNVDFEEKYCHFSGEASNGKTSMTRPILAKNWKKSQNSNL